MPGEETLTICFSLGFVFLATSALLHAAERQASERGYGRNRSSFYLAAAGSLLITASVFFYLINSAYD